MMHPFNVLRHVRQWERSPRDPVSVGAMILGANVGTTALIFGLTGQAIVGYLVTTAITSWAMSALTPKPDFGGLGGSRGTLVNSVDPAAPHEYVYGTFRKGGIRTYMESTGDNNKFLHMIISMAGHEIEEFVEFYVNDEVVTLDANGFVTSDPWNSKIRIKAHDGSQLSADPDLVSESNQVDANFVGRGIAYMYIRLEYDQDVFTGGIPLFTAKIKGRKVYDPRSTSTAYSANAALCIRDYLTSDIGMNDDAVDDTIFASQANVCDELVALAGGGSQKRYESHGVVSADMTPREIVERLITSCAGTLFWGQGNWQLRVGYYTPPVKTFTLDDLRGSISIDTRISARDNFNRIVGVFSDADVDYIASDYPAIESSVFLAEDAGVENTLDLTLPFTTSSAMAQRLAKLTLFRGREQMTVTADFGLEAFEVQAGDIVALTIDRYGWDAKEFEVTGWNFRRDEDGEIRVAMTLRETSEAAFAWGAEEAQIIYNNTNLLSGFEVPTPTLNAATVATVINNDGTAFPQIGFSWSVTDSSLVDGYDFQWKLTSAVEWNSTRLAGNSFNLSPAISGAAYNYRVRAINTLGVRSAFVSSASPVSTGDDGTTPKAPTWPVSGAATAGTTSIKLKWVAPTKNTDNSTIKDLFQYKIYRATSNSFGAASLVGRVAADVFTDGALTGGQVYYYWVTALDYSGNESSPSTSVSATAAEALDTRNKGVYYIGTTTLPTTSSGAYTDFVAAIGEPSEGAQAWFYTGDIANPTAQSVWIYENGAFNNQENVLVGDLIVDGTVTAEKMNVENLSAITASLGDVTITNTLRLQEGSAGFIGGRTSSSAYDEDGFFMARTDKGDGLKGFEVSHTSTINNQLSGIIHQDGQNMKVFNPDFYLGGDISGGVDTTINDVNLGQTTEVVMTLIGGGGGGGSGRDDGTGSGTGGAGGDTVVRVWAGSILTGTLIGTYTATGGAGGANASYSTGSGENGEATVYGLGGAGGPRNTAGSNAPLGSYGAGGGGGGGDASSLFDSSGWSGYGGHAGQVVEATVDTSAYFGQDIWLEVNVGTGGSGSTAYSYYGGAGQIGAVSYASPLGGTTKISLSNLFQKFVPQKTWSGSYNSTQGPNTVSTGYITLPAGWYRTSLTISLTVDGAGSDNNYGGYYEFRQIVDGVSVILQASSYAVGSSGYTITYNVNDQLYYFGGNDIFQVYEADINNSAAGVHSWSVVLTADGPYDNGTYA